MVRILWRSSSFGPAMRRLGAYGIYSNLEWLAVGLGQGILINKRFDIATAMQDVKNYNIRVFDSVQ